MKDKFGRKVDTLRISITDKCNFRCLYCSKEFYKLNKKNILSYEEIVDIVKFFTNFGIKKIKITGGEPLIKKNIYYLINKISKIDGIKEVSITTNGYFLCENVERLKKVGVKRVNISLDTLKSEKFEGITSVKGLEKIICGIKESVKNFDVVKLNIVLMKEINLDEIYDFLKFAEENKVILKFIELMPVYKNYTFWKENFVPYFFVEEILKKYIQLSPICENGRIKKYENKDKTIYIEFVTPVSEPFCKNCDRLRIDCKGNLFSCLYGEPIFNFKNFNNKENEILGIIFSLIFNRKFSYNPFLEIQRSYYKLPYMNIVGG
ncbi:MAG TPA: GTP 3',8-cyclase MoaA [bacterium]|nr:GTP 3',8-cyclase MoaA [bacterium]HOM27199.1 GTP 3',8-cyclase MoaA [bacterium]